MHLSYVRFIALSRISYLTHGDDINSSNVSQVALGRFFNKNFLSGNFKILFLDPYPSLLVDVQVGKAITLPRWSCI
jgi:hypothetical protein